MKSKRSAKAPMENVVTLGALVLVGLTSVGASPCEKPTIARCAIGMSMDEIQALLPSWSIESKTEVGTVLKAKVASPIPQVKLNEGTLRVTFDPSGRLLALWFRATTEQNEQEVLKAAEQLWGASARVRGANGVRGLVRTYDMHASWRPRCGAQPMLNVAIDGDPSVTTVNIGLELDDD